MLSDRLRIQSQHRFPELVLSAQVLLNCGGGGTCQVSLQHITALHDCTSASIVFFYLFWPQARSNIQMTIPAEHADLFCGHHQFNIIQNLSASLQLNQQLVALYAKSLCIPHAGWQPLWCI